MSAFYNEIDPFAAQWLRNLISAGHIAPGIVDERDIRDIKPSELRHFTQCHFFAGIGVWSYGLRLAGWPDERPIWTGSCPCQPFSASGKRGGFDDERHLWPAWQHLIHECGPSVIAGEQVASKDGYSWLDLVQADLEGMGYACGAVVSPSAGYGAPHERHRQFFGAVRLADTTESGWITRGRFPDTSDGRNAARVESGRLCDVGVVGNTHDARSQGRIEPERQCADEFAVGSHGLVSRLDDAGRDGWRKGRLGHHGEYVGKQFDAARANGSVADSVGGSIPQPIRGSHQRDGFSTVDAEYRGTGPTNGFWSDVDWLFCRDERWRPVEPGTFPLAHGSAARVGRLRGYGNAINAHQAKAFIEAFAETIDGTTEIDGAANGA